MSQNLNLLRQKYCRPASFTGKRTDHLFPLEEDFVLPLIVSAYILTAAILNASQGSLPTVLFADNNLRNLLSIAFRISLIPGVAVLVYRALKSLRYHPRDERLAVILVLLTRYSPLRLPSHISEKQ